MPQGDITTTLISTDRIVSWLPTIFVDSIIVDNSFSIVVASQNILDLIGFKIEHLQKKSIGCILADPLEINDLKKEITAGYFDEREILLNTSANDKVRVAVSGFYLGLISDLNNLIVLRMRNLDIIARFEEKLEKKATELDNFIYRTAHDLRGPLATIKGLINLIKLRENDLELDHLHLLLETHANRLDERLFHLLYLADSCNQKQPKGSTIDFSEMETQLRRIIEQNAFLDFLEFHFSAPAEPVQLADAESFALLLNNLLLYFLSLPMNKSCSMIFLRIGYDHSYFVIDIAAQGFGTSDNLKDAIGRSDSLYTDLIHYPELLNFYAAHKVTLKIGGNIHVKFIGEDKQRLTVRLPFNKVVTTCSE